MLIYKMAKHSKNVKFVELKNLLITTKNKKKYKCKYCPETKRNCKLRSKRISQIDSSIKEKTFYFDYEYILNSIDDQIRLEKSVVNDIDFSKHPEINSKMFTILLNWICEVHLKFKLCSETLYLTHQVITQYLAKGRDVKRKNLQLIGISALFLCSKYEDIYPPEIKECVYTCDNAYNKNQIINMEWEILSKFDFNLLYTPTIYNFISLFSFFGQFDEKITTCTIYLCNTTLLCTSFLKYKMSEIVASAIAISIAYNNSNETDIFPKDIAFCSCYTLDDIKNCIITFNEFFSEQSNFKNGNYFYKQYSNIKFNKIAIDFEEFNWSSIIKND